MHGAILLAGGSGLRMQKQVDDKLLHPIGKTNSFRLCCDAFLQVQELSSIVVVFRDERQRELLKKEYARVKRKTSSSHISFFVQGGKTRLDSLANGLLALPEDYKFVHVHDCARPLIRGNTISEIIRKVEKIGSVAVCRPLTDTIRESLDVKIKPEKPKHTRTLNRDLLWLMETPQSAKKIWLEEGIKLAKEKNINVTDEISLIELCQRKTGFHELNYANPKITHFEDLNLIKHLMNQ